MNSQNTIIKKSSSVSSSDFSNICTFFSDNSKGGDHFSSNSTSAAMSGSWNDVVLMMDLMENTDRQSPSFCNFSSAQMMPRDNGILSLSSSHPDTNYSSGVRQQLPPNTNHYQQEYQHIKPLRHKPFFPDRNHPFNSNLQPIHISSNKTPINFDSEGNEKTM